MIVYPAIDIRGGRCVRLIEGDFNREIVFDADPADAARRWGSLGAEWLHVVDLDGALEGRTVNAKALAAIRAAIAIPIQFGGGLRSIAAIEAAFTLGIDRAILGTSALRDPDLVASACARWPGRIAVGLDARGGKLEAQGWTAVTDLEPIDVALRLERAGVRHFVVTDIGRDGTLAGPNVQALQTVVDSVKADVIASGGVGALADIEAIRETGAAGAVIGRALYDGRVDLESSIRLARAIETVT
ncbi:MAG: 1-(5-phosphoribosyl)-5-[(5-phosphoribosylamino)methylideneamino]imidazole-4-carboxamide isomerase [Thermomicrobiales bacterium]